VITLETYETEQGRMVAAADAELIGDRFEGDGVRIEVDPDFYGDRDKTAPSEDVIEALHSASIANLVGEDAVEAGMEAEVIEERNVLRVDGVPHAQMVRL
jgi:hypothetical protein